MSTFNLKYDKLFSIAFSHSRFPPPSHENSWLSPLSVLLDILPDSLTRQLFGKHDIHTRFEQDVLTCYIRVDADGQRPFHALPNDIRMRFIINATPTFLSKTIVADTWGREHMYHVKVRLKTTTSSATLGDTLLTTVEASEPDRIFHMHTGDEQGHWELVPVNLKGHFAVIDLVSEGTRRNRLYANEAQQRLYYTRANNKQDEHLYQLILN